MHAGKPGPCSESGETGPRSSSADDLIDWIRAAILGGTFFPQHRLVEEELAQQLHTNRATIRVALAVLEQQGLVIRTPNKGARVRLVTEREALEIMETRSRLESLTARDAAYHATDLDIDRLRKLQQELGALLAVDDLVGFSTLNIQLHGEISRISRHGTATKILDSLYSQTVAFQFRPLRMPGRTKTIDVEHAELIEAIARRNPAEAEAAMRLHLDNSLAALRTAITALSEAKSSQRAKAK
jgi:DNA-binding GntR family transcriptional regulator